MALPGIKDDIIRALNSLNKINVIKLEGTDYCHLMKAKECLRFAVEMNKPFPQERWKEVKEWMDHFIQRKHSIKRSAVFVGLELNMMPETVRSIYYRTKRNAKPGHAQGD